MKSIQFIFTIVILTLVSCNTSESLDKYYVTHQEKQGFMAVDVPTSILEIDTDSLTQDQKKAYQSISKLNFLGLKNNDVNKATFTTEKKKVKEILTNTKYKSLVRFHHDDKQGMVTYIGNPEAIDELILFGADEKYGFAIVRVLGEDMNPQKVFDLLSSLKGKNINTQELKKIANFFKK